MALFKPKTRRGARSSLFWVRKAPLLPSPPTPGEDVPLAVEFRRRSGDVILQEGIRLAAPSPKCEPRRSVSSRSERLIRLS